MRATLIDSMGSDLSVVNAARVSFGHKSSLEEDAHGVFHLKDKDKRLIKYLAKHKHYSPFGHAFATFHVKAPIFVARQLVKHKFLRWNEISRRYVSSEPEFYYPDDWRGKSEDKKQGSEGIVTLLPEDHMQLNRADVESLTAYDSLLKAGVAPEMARMVLPQSMMTEWYWSGSLDAFADMCKLRLKTDTQAETRVIAEHIDQKMSKLFPVSWECLVSPEKVEEKNEYTYFTA